MRREETELTTVAVGLVADPSITSGPWVVHRYWDSLPPGSGVPIYDTPCKPAPVREVASRSARRPTHSFRRREKTCRQAT